MEATVNTKQKFFSQDKNFKKRLWVLLITITLQNVIAYSVNMADNIMLGAYSQEALSGAATVNQIFFVVQQLALAVGDALIMIGSQYWGKHELSPIRKLAGIALKTTAICCVIIFIACTFLPQQILSIFTSDQAIMAEGLEYIKIVKYSFLMFMFTNCLMCALRAVEVVKIAFKLSVMSLIINAGINWLLIFGNLGCPEMGIKGAAIGTITARAVELIVAIFYVTKKDNVLRLFSENPFKKDKELSKDYRKAAAVMITTEMCWAVATPFQSAVLGSMTADAIAANSIATTFYNFLKVAVRAGASAGAVLIGFAIGEGDYEEVKAKGRTLSVIYVVIGIVMGALLFVLRKPLLSMYVLTPAAYDITNQMIMLYSIIMVGMSYQMPVTTGVIRAGGDTRFHMITGIMGTWCLSIPLGALAAYVWHLPVILVVLATQSDQLVKCIPVFIKFRKYNWIKKLTH